MTRRWLRTRVIRLATEEAPDRSTCGVHDDEYPTGACVKPRGHLSLHEDILGERWAD